VVLLFKFKIMSIRDMYVKHGASEYYEQSKDSYVNPHYEYIKNCLHWMTTIIDPKVYLDLGCGNGEVTRYLTNRGYFKAMGLDPYFSKIYKENTDRFCINCSFEFLAIKGIPFTYDTIIASYSIHLCLPSFRKQLYYQLSKICKYLVIISPNDNYTIDEHFTLINETKMGKSHCKIWKTI